MTIEIFNIILSIVASKKYLFEIVRNYFINNKKNDKINVDDYIYLVEKFCFMGYDEKIIKMLEDLMPEKLEISAIELQMLLKSLKNQRDYFYSVELPEPAFVYEKLIKFLEG